MHKRVPGEPKINLKREHTTIHKIMIIFFALLGAFLLGIGMDLEMCSLMMPGFIMIIIGLFLALFKVD